MLEKIRQKWLEWIFAVVLIIITTILTNYATVKREGNTRIKSQLEQKADRLYVDRQDEYLKVVIKEGDENVKAMLEQHARETNERTLSMDRKLDILLSRTK